MFRTFLVLLICNSLLWQYADAGYSRGTSRRMRWKLIKMALELAKDSKAKVMSIWHIRKHYTETSAYQIARLVYYIRRKYARQIFIYFKILNKFDDFNHHIHLDHLREIQNLAFDIDHLIYAIEKYEDKNTRKKRITRMGGPRPKMRENLDPIAKRQKGERLKQRAYVERKKMLWSLNHGNNRDNLERSQFQRRNPVEEGFESDSFNF